MRSGAKGTGPRAARAGRDGRRREKALAVHATLRTPGGRPLFRDPGLAWAVLARLAGCGATLAVRLDPDRLEWLLAGARSAARAIDSFRDFSDRLARRLGHEGALWTSGGERRPVASTRELESLAARLGEAGSETGSPYRFSRLRLRAGDGAGVRPAARRGRRGRARSSPGGRR